MILLYFAEFNEVSDLMGKRIVFIWLLLAFAWVAKSQNYMIKGIVTDSITGEPLPYVAVILKGTTIGATTDLDGAFTLSSSSKVRTLQVSYLGYTEKELKFVPGKAEHLKIQLAPTSINLSEVIIKPGKERYRKKDNPAVTFIKTLSHVGRATILVIMIIFGMINTRRWSSL